MLFYCPELGRFLSRDMIRRPGRNEYLYVEGEPLTQVDPRGLEKQQSVLGNAIGGPISGSVAETGLGVPQMNLMTSLELAGRVNLSNLNPLTSHSSLPATILPSPLEQMLSQFGGNAASINPNFPTANPMGLGGPTSPLTTEAAVCAAATKNGKEGFKKFLDDALERLDDNSNDIRRGTLRILKALKFCLNAQFEFTFTDCREKEKQMTIEDFWYLEAFTDWLDKQLKNDQHSLEVKDQLRELLRFLR